MAQTIVAEARSAGPCAAAPGRRRRNAGEGIEGRGRGPRVVVGGQRFVAARLTPRRRRSCTRDRHAGSALTVAVGVDGRLAGDLMLADALRGGTEALAGGSARARGRADRARHRRPARRGRDASRAGCRFDAVRCGPDAGPEDPGGARGAQERTGDDDRRRRQRRAGAGGRRCRRGDGRARRGGLGRGRRRGAAGRPARPHPAGAAGSRGARGASRWKASSPGSGCRWSAWWRRRSATSRRCRARCCRR